MAGDETNSWTAEPIVASNFKVVTVRMVVKNAKAVNALAQAIQLAEELVEAYPWDSAAGGLLKRLRYAAKHLHPKIVRRK
jgi:hypothetical protein